MKLRIVAMALAITATTSYSKDIELTPAMQTVLPSIQSCLNKTDCSEKLKSLMDTEKKLYKSIQKWIDTKPRQMMFEYDYMMFFSTLKSKIKNLEFPEDVKQALQSGYINDVETKSDEMIENAK